MKTRVQKLFQWKKPLIALLIFTILCIGVHLFGFHLISIRGSSMNETLKSGEIALVTKFDYLFGRQPRRGDIVECRFPNRSGVYVKRLIGLPGETIEIIGGRLYINGTPLSEPYVSSPGADYHMTLGEDEYLVLGDNRVESHDSRAEDMGLLTKDDFIGRVRIVVYPFRTPS